MNEEKVRMGMVCPQCQGRTCVTKSLQGLGVRDMDKDLDSVGVRRQSRSPPNTVVSLLGQRGSSQIRSAALPYTARSFIAAKHWDHK